MPLDPVGAGSDLVDHVRALRGASGDLDEICRVASGMLGPRTDLEVTLWVLDLDGEHLQVEARWPPRPRDAGPDVLIDVEGHGYGRLLAGGEPVRADARSLPVGWALDGAGDTLLVPLAVADRRPGVLVVSVPAGAPPLSDDEVAAASGLEERLALLVDHARLLIGARRSSVRQGILRRIGERALSPESLDGLEQLFVEDVRSAIDADAVIVYRALPDGVNAVVVAQVGFPAVARPGREFPLSPHTLAMIGADRDEVVAMDVDAAMYADTLAAAVGAAASCKVVLRPKGETPVMLAAGRRASRMFAGPDRRFLAAAAQLLTTAIELRSSQAKLRHEATADALTGLANRAMLYERLHAAITTADLTGEPVALVLADLDGFKLVNDSMGHTEGDRLLATVAARLASVVRPDDLVARLGGDEFAVVCSRTDERGAVAVAERSLEALGGAIALAHRRVAPRASVGVAVYEPDATRAEPTDVRAVATQLVQQADVAMYRAKAAGGSRVAVYDAVLDQQVRRRLAVEEGLRAALADGALTLAFQPIVDLASGRIRSMETLVRWFDDELGHVSPGEFVPIAEESDLVCDLDAWVLRHAAAQMVRWIAAGAQMERIGVNLSARNFAQPGLAARVSRILDEVGCPPGRVLVEITESLLTEGVGPAAVHELLAIGIDVAIDDFGAGFSSLAQLKRVPVRYLKIDRGFVAGLLTDPTDGAIIRSTLALARELGKRVVAEGVETPEQLRELGRLGCHLVQGYLLGRPSDGATAGRWLMQGLDTPLAELLAAAGHP